MLCAQADLSTATVADSRADCEAVGNGNQCRYHEQLSVRRNASAALKEIYGHLALNERCSRCYRRCRSAVEPQTARFRLM